MKILITGAAGFIGAHLARACAQQGHAVVGLDNYAPYYDPAIKRHRVQALCPNVEIHTCDITDTQALQALFKQCAPTHVVHLAAQPGVRYSMKNPYVYTHTNVHGFIHILELCRHHGIEHLLYASSSSVYGDSAEPPFSEAQRIDQPRSLYAATKAANELMAYTYSQLYGIRATGLRFFTVYGPWGRPDMAPVLFSRAILAGRPIQVFNHGRLKRDFTFIKDITSGIIGAMGAPPSASSLHEVFNLGNHTPVDLASFISTIEHAAGRPAIKQYVDMQPGDMLETMADTQRAQARFGFSPKTPIAEGLPSVVAWCKSYFSDAV